MLTLSLDASATNYYFKNLEFFFATTTTNVCDVAKVESFQKTIEKKSKFGYTIMEGQIVFFLVMNFCTAIFTQEEGNILSQMHGFYYQRVVQNI
jgi:hypothetical protein